MQEPLGWLGVRRHLQRRFFPSCLQLPASFLECPEPVCPLLQTWWQARLLAESWRVSAGYQNGPPPPLTVLRSLLGSEAVSRTSSRSPLVSAPCPVGPPAAFEGAVLVGGLVAVRPSEAPSVAVQSHCSLPMRREGQCLVRLRLGRSSHAMLRPSFRKFTFFEVMIEFWSCCFQSI